MGARRVRFVRDGQAEDGGWRLHLEPGAPGESTAEERRWARAAEWAVDLDGQFRVLIQTGSHPRVIVPAEPGGGGTRVRHHSELEYRSLRLGVGALIRPLLVGAPNLDALFPFQRFGVRWLLGPTLPDIEPVEICAEDDEALMSPARVFLSGKNGQDGVILADDMGLGKTIQVISAMRLLFYSGEARFVLIVCPKSLISNWERELARWAPELGVAVITPPAAIRDDAWNAVARRRHVVLTNYEQFRRPPTCLLDEAPDLIVADEAHRIRSRNALTTSGFRRMTPRRCWALTGTPIERRLVDLATLLSVVSPERFSPEDGGRHPSSLRSRARRYVLRRRKQDVLSDLPPVLQTTEVLDLTGAQARAYRTAVEGFRRHGGGGEALSLLSRLQTLCDFDRDSGESSKIDRILELLERIHGQGERAVIFSHRIEPLRVLQARIAERWGNGAAELLIGEMDRDERDRSVENFRRDGLTLLASLHVGGEGLTLVEANHVFLFNQWWNPSTNDQALARVVRIGQQRKVRLYRFCCRGTIEESLERILTSKRELFDDVVEGLARGAEDAERQGWSRVVGKEGIESLLSQDGP